MKMQTIEELNKKICDALSVDYSEFVKMTSDEKNKIVRRYTTEIKGLKFKNHK